MSPTAVLDHLLVVKKGCKCFLASVYNTLFFHFLFLIPIH